MAVLSILNAVNLPREQGFTVPLEFPGSQLLLVSGSAWSNSNEVTLEVDISVTSENGVATQVGPMKVYSNGDETHRAFAPLYSPLNLTPGSTYTLSLQPAAGGTTITDENDWFNVALVG